MAISASQPPSIAQAYISAHVSDYKISLAGWDDFVGNSSVMGPTMEEPPVGAPGSIEMCSTVRRNVQSIAVR